MNRLPLTLLIAVSGAYGADARLTAVDAFYMAPTGVMPLVSPVSRTEMVTLFEAGLADQSAPNVLGGPTKILSLSPDAVTLSHAADATITIALLPMAKGDTALVTIETLPTPIPDTNVRVYTRDWAPLPAAYTEPSVADWAAKGHEAEAAETIPFMLATGSWDEASRTLTLTPTVEQWLDEETRPRAATMLRPSLTLKWNGKKFIISR